MAEEGAPATQAQKYVDALKANGRSAAVWDVAKQGAPHPLGVLSHFPAVVHYTGDPVPGAATQLAVRDYLNEGGKLIEAGERAGGNVDLGEAPDRRLRAVLPGRLRTRSPHPAPTASPAAARSNGVSDAARRRPRPTRWTRPGRFTVTSDNLPADEFPQFKSAAAGSYPASATPTPPSRARAWPRPPTPTRTGSG